MNVDREKLAPALSERERQLEQARAMLNEATRSVKLVEEAMEGLMREMHESIASVGAQARARVVRIQEENKTRVAEVVAEYAEDNGTTSGKSLKNQGRCCATRWKLSPASSRTKRRLFYKSGMKLARFKVGLLSRRKRRKVCWESFTLS